MTRALLGLAALDVLYAIAGGAFLAALRPRSVRLLHPAGIALALVTGWALTGIVLSTVLTLGAPANAAAVALIVAVVAATSLGIRRRTGGRVDVSPERAPLSRAGWMTAGVGGAIVALALLHELVRVVREGADKEWDVWAFWLAKAKTLHYFGGLDSGPGGFTSYPNADYPPLAPVTEAAAFSFMGDVAPAYLPIQHWVLAVAFLGGLVSLLAPRVPPYLLWPSLALLATAPGFRSLAASALADPQVAMVLGIAAVLLALAVLEDDTRLLVLGGVFLAAAALVKTEGLVVGVVLAGVAAAAAVVTSGWRTSLRFGALALGAVAALLPWKLWLYANEVPVASTLYDYGLVRQPGELVARFPRMSYALDEMARLLLDPGRWLIVVPLVLAAALLVAVQRSRLGVIAAAWLGVAFVALAAAYWVSTADLYWHVVTSASRILTTIGVIAGALLPVLLAELHTRYRGGRERPLAGA